MQPKSIYCFLIFAFFAQLASAGKPQLSPLISGRQQIGTGYVSIDDDSVIFFENFEAGIGNWETVDLTDPGPLWHRDTFNAYAGQSWWCSDAELGGYENNWLQFLISPTISLAGATNPILSFQLYYAIETPSSFGEYDGWDGCNVWYSVTGGNIWEVLQPETPLYTCNNLYSFGWRWEMYESLGFSIPGWADFSGGWIDAQINLSFLTVENVQLRFAFCSDEANCTATDPSLLGCFIDSIEVRDGQDLYLSNYADGNGYPSEFTSDVGEPYGDYWTLTEDTYHSPNHCWNCDDRELLSDALVSPPITIPANMSTKLSYWVYCDMPDFDGDYDDYLDDYYYIEVSPVGSPIWSSLIYDWGHNGAQLQWVERSNGYWDTLPTEDIDLTPWAGQEVQIRFRTVTDGNNDGGQGAGVFIDDVTIISSILPENDTGAKRLMVPFPTFEGQSPIECSVDLVNYGTANQSQVPAFWEIDGIPNELIPWAQIGAGETVRRYFEWEPQAAGPYEFRAYTNLENDEKPSNDTCYAGIVEVTPSGTFEFGYDHRQITYMPDFNYFNFVPGFGVMVYFTPAADGIPGDLYSETLKVMFYSEGTFSLHLYSAGSPEIPGGEIHFREVAITSDQVFPNWAEIDISDVQYLQGGHNNFWVWLEITQTNNAPHITGHFEDAFTSDHFYAWNGFELNPTIINFNVRVIMTGTTPVEPLNDEPNRISFELSPVFPNPFNSFTNIAFTLPFESQVRLDVYNILGKNVAELINQTLRAGEHEVVWNAKSVPSGVYLVNMNAAKQSVIRKIVLLK